MNELKKDLAGTLQGSTASEPNLYFRDQHDYGAPTPGVFPEYTYKEDRTNPFCIQYRYTYKDDSAVRPAELRIDELANIYAGLISSKDPEVTKLEKQLAEVQKKLADRKKRVEVENRIKELQAKIQAAQKELDSI